MASFLAPGLVKPASLAAMPRRKTGVLTAVEARRRVASLPGWRLAGKRIVRTWRFDDFAHALAFVNRVGALAENRNHHPDVVLRWGHVRLSITTHDAGGLTEKDFDLAGAVSRIV